MANAITRLLFDPVDSDRESVPRRYQFDADNRWWTIAMGIGIAALAVGAAVGLAAGGNRFLFAYLVAWAFCVSVALGCMLFVMIQHLTKARWSTTLRRIPEAVAANFPLLALAGLPILFGIHGLYHWSHADLYEVGGAHFDPVLAGKAGYFYFPFAAGTFPFFFVLRYVLFFGIWSVIGRKLYTLSVRNDAAPSVETTLKLRWWSALGIPLTAVTLAFASYDWLMSTDPHWFSTMFGVYFFAGGWLGALCLITFVALLLKKGGMVDQEITREHLQDMGKFMFGFTVFWTYIAFSQYMLYWYANLPEEIVWFQKRFTAGWGIVAWALFAFHFVLPFLILLPRITKRTYPLLATMCVWLLVMHWVDLWWIATPAMLPVEGQATEHVESSRPDRPLLAQAQEVPLTTADPVIGDPVVAEPLESNPVIGDPPGGLPDVEGLQEDGFQTGATVPQATGGMAPGQPAAAFNPVVIPPAVPIVEFMTWLGLFSLLFGVTLLRLARHALTPYGDPYFADALRFQNV